MNRTLIADGLMVTGFVMLVSAIYYFIPTNEHLFTNGGGSQVTAGFLCLVVTIVALLVGGLIMPKKQTHCPHCHRALSQQSDSTEVRYER
jgi:peptidoglycan/LPS O-acetylase OafA/YrhL